MLVPDPVKKRSRVRRYSAQRGHATDKRLTCRIARAGEDGGIVHLEPGRNAHAGSECQLSSARKQPFHKRREMEDERRETYTRRVASRPIIRERFHLDNCTVRRRVHGRTTRLISVRILKMPMPWYSAACRSRRVRGRFVQPYTLTTPCPDSPDRCNGP